MVGGIFQKGKSEGKMNTNEGGQHERINLQEL